MEMLHNEVSSVVVSTPGCMGLFIINYSVMGHFCSVAQTKEKEKERPGVTLATGHLESRLIGHSGNRIRWQINNIFSPQLCSGWRW